MIDSSGFKFVSLPFQCGQHRVRIWDNEKNAPLTLLFLHGYGAMIEHWEHNLPFFNENYRVIAADLLGFGKSDKPDILYSLKLWGEEIELLAHYFSLQNFVLIGQSMGAASSVMYVRHFEHKLSRLVLIDCSGHFPKPLSLFEKSLYQLVGSPFIGDALFSVFGNEYGSKMSLLQTYYDPAFVTENLVNAFSESFKNPNSKFAYLAPSKNPDLFQLTALTPPVSKALPTQLIWGKHDKAFPPYETMPFFQNLFPNSTIHVVDQAAHCPHHEQPERVNQLILKFIHSSSV
ncbi:MAG: alpha/beta hydrolase [Chloroherpetonaceae bacterium]|nr:alpha/beta hydrolase [Chloroherpetonaceae bacterium]